MKINTLPGGQEEALCERCGLRAADHLADTGQVQVCVCDLYLLNC